MEKIKKTDKYLSFRGAGKTLSGSSYAAKIQQFFVFAILLKKIFKILQTMISQFETIISCMHLSIKATTNSRPVL